MGRQFEISFQCNRPAALPQFVDKQSASHIIALMMSKNIYTWSIPIIWFVFSLTLYFNPGDEHGAFAIGSILGLWPFVLLNILFKYTLNYGFNTASAIIITIGMLCCIGLGYVMDRLKINLKWLLLFFIILSAFLFTCDFFNNFGGSIERVRWKNGTLICNLALWLNFSLTTSVLGSIVLIGVKRLVARFLGR